jgi:hypothetical protein
MKKSLTEEQNYLKERGEKVILDYNNCEIKENNYYDDVTPRGFSKYEMAQGYTEEFVEKSVIIYRHKNDSAEDKFISQTFPFNETTLLYHIMQGDIILYVDRFDKSKYFFDFVSD